MAFRDAVTLTAETLAGLLKGSPAGEVADLLEQTLETLDDAFAHAHRPVLEATANDCVVKVAQAIADGRKASRAGKQLATVEAGTATRAPQDPLDPIRHVLARHVVPL